MCLPLYSAYTVFGLVIGVYVYNYGQPYSVSAGLYPLLGERSQGRVSSVVDLLSVFGIAGGVSACLGVLCVQGVLRYAGALPLALVWWPRRFFR